MLTNESPRRISTSDLLRLHESLVTLQEATGRDWYWSPLSNQLFADISDFARDQIFVKLQIMKTNWLSFDLDELTEIDYDESRWTSSYSDIHRGSTYSARGPSPLRAFISMCMIVQEKDPDLAELILAEGYNDEQS